MLWRARQFEFRFPRPTLVMGIVNVTPDSFSDGGRYLDPEAAIAHGKELVAQGADLLDIGGESTRPGAEPVPADEELRRVLPVLRGLAREVNVPLSIDTLKPVVARAALAAGASIVNDVAAVLHRGDHGLQGVLAETGAGYIAMHMQGTPATMQDHPVYTDVVAEVREFLAGALDDLVAGGVAREQVALDVGIGFGKALDHNLELLGGMTAFRQLGRPMVLGVSRKSFLGRLTGRPVGERLAGALAATCLAYERGLEIVRTHDVAEVVQALRVAEAIRSRHRP